jgi:hypothetical protein
MLNDMPDETEAALAKRQLIQDIMKDSSLSGVEKNKKIQDVMAGRVELPKLKAQPQAVQATKAAIDEEERNASSAGLENEEDSVQESENEAQTYPVQSETEASGGNGADAMLNDMPDETDSALAKRRAFQELMKDESLSAQERTKMIQDSMAGKVPLPPPPAKPLKESVAESAPNREKKSKKAGNKDTSSPTLPEVPVKAAEDIKARPREPETAEKEVDSRKASTDKKPDKHPFVRQPSMEGGTPTSIAYEWKQQMMAVHPKSHDTLLDILLAHRYRLSLKSPPIQSSFRVVAVVFFSRVVGGVRRSERFHVVGTNDEPHSIAGSICAERAALMQLRFVPDLEEITKVVIVTDDTDAISPGMLCREFMASDKRISNTTPIVLGRSVCRKCGLTLSGKACGDSKGRFNEAENEHWQEVQRDIFAPCSEGKKGSNSKYPPPHDFVGTTTTLKELFPYPSLYTNLSADEAMEFGQMFAVSGPVSKNNPNEGGVGARSPNINADNDDVTTGSYRQERFDLSLLSDAIGDNDDETEEKPSSPSRRSTPSARRDNAPSESFTTSLKQTVDFMRQVREDGEMSLTNRHELYPSVMNGLVDLPGTLDHLTARTLRISARLKPSQRREKLLRLATEATALEIHQRHIHPIRYGAAVLFSDGTAAIASQKVALEYGCTLDAVGQLASVIDKKALQFEEGKPACRPVLLVQCDHFGIAHAPFAQGRSFLTERGYGDCKVLVHQQRQIHRINEEEDGVEATENNEVDLRLIEVLASDLAPSPPDMFGKAIAKSHSQGLQIQF